MTESEVAVVGKHGVDVVIKQSQGDVKNELCPFCDMGKMKDEEDEEELMLELFCGGEHCSIFMERLCEHVHERVYRIEVKGLKNKNSKKSVRVKGQG